MGKRGVAHGGGKIGGAKRIDRHGKENVAHHHGHISAHAGRAVDLAEAFLDQLVESWQAAAALGLVDDVIVDQDEGVEQFQRQARPAEASCPQRPGLRQRCGRNRAAEWGGCVCRGGPRTPSCRGRAARTIPRRRSARCFRWKKRARKVSNNEGASCNSARSWATVGFMRRFFRGAKMTWGKLVENLHSRKCSRTRRGLIA